MEEKDLVNIKQTIFDPYETIIFDLDGVLWDCYQPNGQTIGAFAALAPFKREAGNIVIATNGIVIRLQEEVDKLIKSLDSANKNLGIVSRSEAPGLTFAAQPAVMLLKSFGLYNYFNYDVIIKAGIEKFQYVKPNGKTLFIDDDPQNLQSVNQKDQVDTLNRKSFGPWEQALIPVKSSLNLNLNLHKKAWEEKATPPSEDEMPHQYWDEKGQFNDLYNELYRKLVPDTGRAETDEGEVLRTISKIYYDRYNNGFGNGPFNIAMLDKYAPEFTNYLDNPGDWEVFLRAFQRTNFGEKIVYNWVGDRYMESVLSAIVLWINDKLQNKQSSLKLSWEESIANNINELIAYAQPGEIWQNESGRYKLYVFDNLRKVNYSSSWVSGAIWDEHIGHISKEEGYRGEEDRFTEEDAIWKYNHGVQGASGIAESYYPFTLVGTFDVSKKANLKLAWEENERVDFKTFVDNVKEGDIWRGEYSGRSSIYLYIKEIHGRDDRIIKNGEEGQLSVVGVYAGAVDDIKNYSDFLYFYHIYGFEGPFTFIENISSNDQTLSDNNVTESSLQSDMGEYAPIGPSLLRKQLEGLTQVTEPDYSHPLSEYLPESETKSKKQNEIKKYDTRHKKHNRSEELQRAENEGRILSSLKLSWEEEEIVAKDVGELLAQAKPGQIWRSNIYGLMSSPKEDLYIITPLTTTFEGSTVYGAVWEHNLSNPNIHSAALYSNYYPFTLIGEFDLSKRTSLKLSWSPRSGEGWIAPNGKFYSLHGDAQDHLDLGLELVRRNYPKIYKEMDEGSITTEQGIVYLLKEGYTRIAYDGRGEQMGITVGKWDGETKSSVIEALSKVDPLQPVDIELAKASGENISYRTIFDGIAGDFLNKRASLKLSWEETEYKIGDEVWFKYGSVIVEDKKLKLASPSTGFASHYEYQRGSITNIIERDQKYEGMQNISGETLYVILAGESTPIVAARAIKLVKSANLKLSWEEDEYKLGDKVKINIDRILPADTGYIENIFPNLEGTVADLGPEGEVLVQGITEGHGKYFYWTKPGQIELIKQASQDKKSSLKLSWDAGNINIGDKVIIDIDPFPPEDRAFIMKHFPNLEAVVVDRSSSDPNDLVLQSHLGMRFYIHDYNIDLLEKSEEKI